jgi:hypothetical protein
MSLSLPAVPCAGCCNPMSVVRVAPLARYFCVRHVMARLEHPTDDVRTAADVRSRALFTRRRAAYLKLSARTPPAKPEPVEEKPTVDHQAIDDQSGRRLPVRPAFQATGSRRAPNRRSWDAGHRIQAACNVADVSADQTQSHHHCEDLRPARPQRGDSRRNAMPPVLDAWGITENDSVQVWVQTALPILFVHIAHHRAKNRAPPSRAAR